MKTILQSLYAQQILTQQQAYDVLQAIANNAYNNEQITAFTSVFMMRKIRIEEFLGFRNSLMDLATKIDLEGRMAMDIVGTGGDEKNTFNISTLSCFVAAGAGAMICKHGNYAASSVSGSSNVMEYFGYKNAVDEQKIKYELDNCGLTFLHAPFFHPALKSVAGIRKNLKVRTFFNQLGPLANPCQPSLSVIGVYHLDVMRLYQYTLQNMNQKYMLLHSLDGYDEIALTSDAKVITPKSERLYSISDMTMLRIQQSDLFGGDTIEEAAKIFLAVLENKATPAQQEVVLVNTAFALMLYGMATTFYDAKNIALQSLQSGKAYEAFKKLMACQG